MSPSSRCRSCETEIIWARHHETESRMPLEPDPDGEWIVRTVSGRPSSSSGARHRFRVAVHDPDGALASDDETRYVSHFATCPDADEWRGRGE